MLWLVKLGLKGSVQLKSRVKIYIYMYVYVYNKLNKFTLK